MADKKKTGDSFTRDIVSRDETDSLGDPVRSSRRRLIQLLTASGVVASARLLPTQWSKPVVESVALPAHAQTTDEVIELGNNESFLTDNAPLPERRESLLASGVDTVAETVERLVSVAHAGREFQDDEDQLGCEPTGCTHIRFFSRQKFGTLFMGVFDEAVDFDNAFETFEISVPFVDGEIGSFAGTCLYWYDDFRVDLIDDFNALLTLNPNGGKSSFPVNLVRPYSCLPPLPPPPP